MPDLRRGRPTWLDTLGHMGYEPAADGRALAAARGDFSKAVRALERECRQQMMMARTDDGAAVMMDGGRAHADAAVARRRPVRRGRRGQLQAELLGGCRGALLLRRGRPGGRGASRRPGRAPAEEGSADEGGPGRRAGPELRPPLQIEEECMRCSAVAAQLEDEGMIIRRAQSGVGGIVA